MVLKIAIFTAIFGGKDELKEPINFTSDVNVDYFLITDEPGIESKIYQIIYKKPIYNDLTKNARYYKIIGLDLFNEYDYVIWHDANIQINHNEIHNLISFATNTGFAFYSHSQRNCMYDEVIKCIKLEKDYPFILLKQVLKYFFAGVGNNSGLYETGLYVKNNKRMHLDFLNLWWNETKRYSRRDQISLPYCIKKIHIVPAIISGNIRKNKYSTFHQHKHSKYKFLTTSTEKPFVAVQKYIAIKTIAFLKKINFNRSEGTS